MVADAVDVASIAGRAGMTAQSTTRTGADLVYECRGLCVDYAVGDGHRRVLEGVDMHVRRGECLSILGSSGAGKTTLLRVLGGLVAATSASHVTFDGQPVDGPPTKAVTVFQDYVSTLLPWRTVTKNVALGLEGKVAKAERIERVAQALELVGLSNRGKDYPWQLSGGMQQRVQLARALAVGAEVLLMDEPFGSLDAMTKASLQDQLQEVRKRTSATVVFITHDIEEAVYLSDRVLVLRGAPGTIAHEVSIDLPWPRDQVTTKETPAYLKYRHEIYRAIGAHTGE